MGEGRAGAAIQGRRPDQTQPPDKRESCLVPASPYSVSRQFNLDTTHLITTGRSMAQQGLDQLGLHGSLLGARAAVTPVRALVSRALTRTLQHRQLGWCLIGQEPVWNGVDLSLCVRLG